MKAQLLIEELCISIIIFSDCCWIWANSEASCVALSKTEDGESSKVVLSCTNRRSRGF